MPFTPYNHFPLDTDFSELIAFLEMDEPPPEMTSLTAQAFNNVELQSQNQRDSTIQLPEPPEATQTQVSDNI